MGGSGNGAAGRAPIGPSSRGGEAASAGAKQASGGAATAEPNGGAATTVGGASGGATSGGSGGSGLGPGGAATGGVDTAGPGGAERSTGPSPRSAQDRFVGVLVDASSGGNGGAGATGLAGAGTSGFGSGGVSTGGSGSVAQAGASAGTAGRSISFGTLLQADAVMRSARELAAAAEPSASMWRAKGDQHRSYRFADSGTDEPYRLYVPSGWDGASPLPLVMFLHGAGSDENTYLDQNDGQLLALAEQHGYLLVSPKGVSGAYGNFLRLTAPFGDEAGAAELMAQVTRDSERTNELSEQDVINVLELVLDEYPIERGSMFLLGHSMGSGGTWYIGGKYAAYWKALAPMSGPFVQRSVYPWDSLRTLSIFVTEGTQAPSLDASRLLRDWLEENAFNSEYREVNADHGGMIRLVLPDIFDFFDSAR